MKGEKLDLAPMHILRESSVTTPVPYTYFINMISTHWCNKRGKHLGVDVFCGYVCDVQLS